MKINESKAFLYGKVAELKQALGYRPEDYNIDIIKALKDGRQVALEQVGYSSGILRGVSFFGAGGERDIILLNKKRSDIERRMDCCHQYLHLWLHRDEGVEVFSCFNESIRTENHLYEWQAKEGSEEFFMPHRVILPIIAESRDLLLTWNGIQTLKSEISRIFEMPDYLIDYRLESLRYEIEQYLNGVPLDELVIISVVEQLKRGINPRTVKEMEIDLLKSSFHR